MTKLSIGQFDKLIDYMKMVRSDFITFYYGMVIGYDKRLCVLKAVAVDESIVERNFAFTAAYTAVVAFRKTLLPMDEVIFDGDRIYATMSECEYVPSGFTVNGIYNKYLELKHNFDCSHTDFGSLRGLDFIEEFLSAKAADGAVAIRVDDRHLMYIPSTALSVNKSDDLLLSIHDENVFFISKFTIVKKKKINVEVYIKFLTL